MLADKLVELKRHVGRDATAESGFVEEQGASNFGCAENSNYKNLLEGCESLGDDFSCEEALRLRGCRAFSFVLGICLAGLPGLA